MRRIVPDNSVMIASYFPGTLMRDGRKIDLSVRARPLRVAIEEGYVLTYAPHSLVNEFVKVTHEIVFSRQGGSDFTPSDAEAVIEDFVQLCQTRVDFHSEIDSAWEAWQLIRQHKLPPTDAWFLACAMAVQGELWITHPQKDGFAQAAQAVYSNVHLLSEEEFRL